MNYNSIEEVPWEEAWPREVFSWPLLGLVESYRGVKCPESVGWKDLWNDLQFDRSMFETGLSYTNAAISPYDSQMRARILHSLFMLSRY
jgi:hypothetical protein|uniref:Uncharacterized protein n=1 Tax=Picea glauca TaxID=3330 RepID=A0A101M218_PICGL|nr:hypothetical protein ABT39_MTgene2754 [Picea glauca]